MSYCSNEGQNLKISKFISVQNAEKSAPPTKRKKMDEMPSLREEIEAMPKDETQVVPDVSQFTNTGYQVI